MDLDLIKNSIVTKVYHVTSDMKVAFVNKENEKELFWDLNTNPLIGVGNHTQPQEQHG